MTICRCSTRELSGARTGILFTRESPVAICGIWFWRRYLPMKRHWGFWSMNVQAKIRKIIIFLDVLWNPLICHDAKICCYELLKIDWHIWKWHIRPIYGFAPLVKNKIYLQKFAHLNQILDSYKIAPPQQCFRHVSQHLPLTVNPRYT